MAGLNDAPGVAACEAPSSDEAAREAFELDAKTRSGGTYEHVNLRESRTTRGYINPGWHADWLLWLRAWNAARTSGVKACVGGQSDWRAKAMLLADGYAADCAEAEADKGMGYSEPSRRALAKKAASRQALVEFLAHVTSGVLGGHGKTVGEQVLMPESKPK